jgi:uncharacterized FAD-dependent dehydrogenase
MIHQIQLVLSPKEAASDSIIRIAISQELSVDPVQISGYKIRKRSVDARSRRIKINLSLTVFIDEPVTEQKFHWEPRDVSNAESVIVIGAGPAGLFAALRLIELGKKPIVIERGKDVRRRRRDLAAINKQHIVNPDSNYCFGEGVQISAAMCRKFLSCSLRTVLMKIFSWKHIRISERTNFRTLLLRCGRIF